VEPCEDPASCSDLVDAWDEGVAEGLNQLSKVEGELTIAEERILDLKDQLIEAQETLKEQYAVIRQLEADNDEMNEDLKYYKDKVDD
jgi:predicted  nucleic acid-binding Zn-ribbon protein